MAGVPHKFRCYQCNQLLGVSLSKVGTTVACPRCSVDLIVPEPLDEGSPGEGEGDSGNFGPSRGAAGSLDAGVSLDLLDIRVEDIRVEPGIDYTPPAFPPPEVPEPPEFSPFLPREPEPDPDPEPYGRPSSRGLVTPTVTAESLAPPTSEREPVAQEAVVPPIRLDAPRRFEPRPGTARSRDVVLPRSAVASWSLFVLLAQGLAFVAGLLAGHFVWKVH